MVICVSRIWTVIPFCTCGDALLYVYVPQDDTVLLHLFPGIHYSHGKILTKYNAI